MSEQRAGMHVPSMQGHARPELWQRLEYLPQTALPSYARAIAWIVAIALTMAVAGAVGIPWVQTAQGLGQTAALDPAQRTQLITAMADGRIKRWHVQDGDRVAKGAPIVELADLDPQLLERLRAERAAVEAKYEAATAATETADLIYQRQQRLFDQGLASRADLERSKIKYKELLAKESAAFAELQAVDVRLARQSSFEVTAPRAGRIVNITAGDNATLVRAGDTLAKLVPNNTALAVELYISGLDAALVESGARVRLEFEGWPAVQFGGWPAVAVGTFGGIVSAVDPVASANGRFRVIVREDPEDPWPDRRYLRLGAKTHGWILLSEVRLGYELWRRLNSFPPLPPAGTGARESQ